MAATDVERLYTRRAQVYPAYVQAFGHRQSLQALLPGAVSLRPGLRVLDAGCGTGLSTRAIVGAMQAAGLSYGSIDAFDLTPAMVESYRETVERLGIHGVKVQRADVLALDEQLPASWNGYDVIVCSSMLEYIPRESLSVALAALNARLRRNGELLVLLTRKSFYLTRWLWQCEGYTRAEVVRAVQAGGFARVRFLRYPWSYVWMNVGNHVVVADAR